MDKLTEAAEKLRIANEIGNTTSPSEDSPASSKNALKKAAKAAEKAKKKAEAAARAAAPKVTQQQGAVDSSEGKYGLLPLIQSTSRTGSGLTSLLIN